MTIANSFVSERTLFCSIQELLENRSADDPDRVAIVAPGRLALSYGELYRHVERTVTVLNGMGIGRNDRVAIVMPNGPEMAVAFLATAAGATSCPLNPAYCGEDFEFFLSDASARAVIVQAGCESPARDVARALGISLIELEPLQEAGAGLFVLHGDTHIETANTGFAESLDIALVLHTSGTTSRPKLVPLTHANLCASVHHICVALELQETDRCLNVMPLFHVHGLVAALLSPLASGGGVVCTPGFQQDEFFPWVNELLPTWFTAVPTMHQLILERARTGDACRGQNPLRFARSSSAALPHALRTEFEKTLGVPLIEAYGMTEGAHQIASNPLPPRDRKLRSVGMTTGTEIAIMDGNGGLLGSDQVGEIVIRGPNVMAGYENNSEANEKSFCHGWFRTGDEGYLDKDGYLFITGRLKEMINRGGEKVAPREVDEALLDHPEIKQAVAFAVPHISLGEDVAAAVVLRDGASLAEESIREFLFGKLADFKIPSRIVIVDQIPKGPTGKVQRIRLFEKLKDNHQPSFVTPRNAVERVLAAIWVEILNVERVGALDNFFVLGGDSIRAIQVVSRIAGIFQVHIPLVEMFRKPTVTALSKKISTSMSSEEVTRITGLVEQMGKRTGQEASEVMRKALTAGSQIPRQDRSSYQ